MLSLRNTLISLIAAFVVLPTASAAAAGGNYVFAGGTAKQQAQVTGALNASAFDWSLVPAKITVHIAPGIATEATAGDIWLDANLLDAGIFSWGTVQHEYAHEVDFFLLDGAKRQLLQSLIGGKDWCYGVSGLAHSQYGCERFASTLAWAYWPSTSNTMKPASSTDEAAAMSPAKFRTLLSSLIGAPDTILPSTVTAFAPPSSKALAHAAQRPKK
ncbi:MAG: hypothetical protein ACYDA3_08295 [Gaiellaceae bacterium]